MGKKPLKRHLISILRWTGWVLLVQFILINISAALYADKLTRYYESLPDGYSNISGNIFTKSWKLFTGPKYMRSSVGVAPVFPVDTIFMKTKKSLPVAGWYGKTDSAAKGTVILFHGITITKSSFIDEANEFRFLGYNVMLVDFRGHGGSGGNITTIGYREAEEVKLAFEYVKQLGEKNIFLYGSSMGAVAVSRAVSEYKLNPSGLILEMPFYSLQSYLKAKAASIGFPKQPFAFFTTFWIGVERGFSGFRHNTTRYMKQVTCPLLLQAGTLDKIVSEKQMSGIYSSAASVKKNLVVYEGAQHESCLRFDTEKWRATVEAFLESAKQ